MRMATLGRLLFRRSVLRLIPPADAKVSERKSSSCRSTSDADAYRSSRDFLRHRRIIRSRSDGTSLTISRSGFGSSRVTAVIIETSRLSLERPPAREPLVEHRAKCKYVTAGISLIACQLFGGHVLYCAYDRARASEGHGRGLFIGRHLLKFGETSSFAPVSVSMMFACLRSRWMMPWRCAALSAPATSIVIFSTRSSGSGPFLMHVARVSPSMYYITR